MKCSVCEREFESRRRDAQYCGDRCRKKAQRVPDKDVTDNFVPDNVPSVVPDKTECKVECAFPTCKGEVYKDRVCREHWDRYCAGYSDKCECGKPRYFGDKCVAHYNEIVCNA
jgi:hypothetical protein